MADFASLLCLQGVETPSKTYQLPFSKTSSDDACKNVKKQYLKYKRIENNTACVCFSTLDVDSNSSGSNDGPKLLKSGKSMSSMLISISDRSVGAGGSGKLALSTPLSTLIMDGVCIASSEGISALIVVKALEVDTRLASILCSPTLMTFCLVAGGSSESKLVSISELMLRNPKAKESASFLRLLFRRLDIAMNDTRPLEETQWRGITKRQLESPNLGSTAGHK